MRASRALLYAALALIALVLQVSVVDVIPLPGSHPDLMLLVVVAAALSGGCAPGAVIGFGIGLLADVAPPSEHTIGRLALVFTVVGYACGFFEDSEQRSVLVPVLVVAGASAVAAVCYTGLGALTGTGGVNAVSLDRVVPFTVGYDVLLTPFVVVPITWLARRLDPGAGPPPFP